MQLRESQKKEESPAPNVREVVKCCVFSMIHVSGESKRRLVKAAGAEVCRQRRNKKLHAAVARSAFSSEKCTKHYILRPLFEVKMSKNCTMLWREAHFEVKMHKTRTLWREAHLQVKMYKIPVFYRTF